MTTLVRGALVRAVARGRAEHAQSLLAAGADPDERDEDGLTALMVAAGRGNDTLVRILLDCGADVYTTDPAAGGTPLHKAVQGGNLACVRQLVEAGAFVNAVTATTGHTPLLDALWYKWPDIAGYLLDRGAAYNLSTHYGFSIRDHLAYALKVNTLGQDRLEAAADALSTRIAADEAAGRDQQLMAAVVAGDTDRVRELLRSGAAVDVRYPMVSGFNDDHTPLLVAARDGHTEIVRELLAAGADVNAVEPTFGAVPLHKAVYNGHVDITRILAEQPGIDLDFRGATNGYTPLHDSIWHGYADCVRILVTAGARLDLVGYEGRTPVEMAAEVFGPDDSIVTFLRSAAARAA